MSSLTHSISPTAGYSTGGRTGTILTASSLSNYARDVLLNSLQLDMQTKCIVCGHELFFRVSEDLCTSPGSHNTARDWICQYVKENKLYEHLGVVDERIDEYVNHQSENAKKARDNAKEAEAR
jgi:hypothetical protein